PHDMVVAGLWMLRLTRKRSMVRVYLPIVVPMHTSRRQVRAWMPDGKGTRPFYQALLDIVAMHPATVQRSNQEIALRQLRQFLEHDIFDEGYKDVTLLVDAQNIRRSLTGFQSPSVLRDVWRLDKRDAGIPIDTLRGRMRVIRLRTSDSQE